ncbi:non-ribosomal peptide synthetase [Xenorhabdus bovienii]|nr:non-ribosomal peptide synthetase [Xenorhabdus bovienii]
MTNKFVLEKREFKISNLNSNTVSEDSEKSKIFQVVIHPADRSQPLPLSFAQQRLWFLEQLDPAANLAHQIPVVLRLTGQLNRHALTSALDRLVARHESLRTRFVSIKGQSYQHIEPAENGFTLSYHDLRQLDSTLHTDRITEFVDLDSKRSFDFTQDPLIRGQLLQLEDETHVLLLNQHHIITDGWSIGVLVHELGALYHAIFNDYDDPLPPLPIQYVDYAVWQREWLQENTFSTQRDFWLEQLADAPALLSLPIVRSRPAVQSYIGNYIPFHLEADLLGSLKALGQRHNTTLFMTVLAAWGVVLARLSGQDDIIIGTPVANRPRRELEGIIGFFVNTLALRIKFSDGLRVTDLLAQVQERVLTAYAHQDLPFEQVVEALQPERSLSYSPIFQVMLAWDNTPVQEQTALSLQISRIEQTNQNSHFDLMLLLTETDTGLSGSLQYATDLFDSATAERMLGYLTNVLAAMVADETKAVAFLPMMSESEQKKLLIEFNSTQADFPQDALIHQLFETQAAYSPSATAIVCGDQELSYDELNSRANRLAHHLITLGVRPDNRIAICVERSLEMVIGLLGILKAGGAYVPLDPAYPTERLAYMLEDAAPIALLTQTTLDGKLITSVPIVLLDNLLAHQEPLMVEQPEHNPDAQALGLASHHLAYVIYTSGSTGLPKGVAIAHSNTVNFLTWAQRTFSPAEFAHTLFATSLNFDLAVYECFAPLLSGGTIHLVPDALSLVTKEYINSEQSVSLINTVPSAITQLLETNAVPVSVRTVNLAGETLKPHIVERLLTHSSVRNVFNLYGPSETTTYSTWTRMNQATGFVSHIGRPIANTQIYILDPHDQPVPLGVVGEIHIAGAGVARGYLNRPELTAERFIRNPFNENAQNRLYKSGDLGRWCADGNIEFMGRNDQQVKMRGYRIELGEIETALTTHESLDTAVVIANNDNDGNKKLIAYVCPTDAWIDKKAQKFNADNLEHWTTIFDEQYSSCLDQTTNKSISNAQDVLIKHENAIKNNNAIESNFSGWNNSYTGQPIATKQMEAWLTGTMQRIKKLHPRRLLEIGCGSGLLLYRYAKDCELVLATDISEVVLTQLQQELKWSGWDHVQLRRGDALSFGALTKSSFDTLIINSVAQYFPNLRYLETLFEQLLPVIESDGKIFLGDIRNLDLLTAHIAAIEQSHLKGQPIQAGILANRLYRRWQQEQELLLSPSYFAHLPKRYPEINRVDILVKRGVGDNEMLRYRYDVILHKGGENTSKNNTRNNSESAFNWYDFETLNHLRDMLQTAEEDTFGVSGIPNTRVKDDLALAENLRHWAANKLITPPEYSDRLSPQAEEQNLAFEILLQYAEQFGYQCGVTWSQKQPDLLDVIFSRGELPPIQARYAYIQTHSANYPQLSTVTSELSTELESALKEQLPDYMIPSLYIPLERLPLTFNNKVDKKALPIPNESDLRRQTYIAPRDEVEETLCQLWQQLLKITQVGIHDNFFMLGGHSLQATRLISSIRNELNVEIPLKSVFEHPTLEQLAQIVTIFLFKEKKEENQTYRLQDIQRNSGAAHYPVSFAQQRLWLIDQLTEGSAQYNCVGDFRLRESLNLSAFEAAVKQVIERHEALRTQFKMIDNEPRQVISTAYNLPITYYDLSTFPETEKKEKVKQLSREEENLVFNLSTDLMLRIRVLKLTENDYVIIYNIHHIACDSWSLEIFVRELLTLYRAYCQGNENPLPALKVQYADYAQWQRNWLQGEVLEKQLDYWQKQLSGIPLLHNFPLDNPRPEKQSFEGRMYSQRISKKLTQAINAQCIKHEVTLFMFLEIAFAVLISRYSNEKDIVIGTALAGRTHHDIEPLIGFFVNSLVIRTDLSGQPTFSELLKHNRGTILDAYTHQDLPFQMLVEKISPERKSNYNPIIQIAFTLENTQRNTTLEQYNSIEFEERPLLKARFDLEIHVYKEEEGKLYLLWIADTSLFNSATIDRLVANYETLLTSIVETMDARLVNKEPSVHKLPLLANAEKHTLLHEFIGTQTQYPHGRCFHELFEEQVSQNPEKIALVFGDSLLSYQALNEQANQLAHYLIAQGIKPDTLVALCIPRSLRAVVALLGILKAGGAYVPLDPSYPKVRLQYMLENSQAEYILTETLLIEKLPVSQQKVISLDTDAVQSHLQNLPTENIIRRPFPLTENNLAYVIYTSGSTGKPKGVMLEHKGWVNLAFAQSACFEINTDIRGLQFSSWSFDAASFELAMTLAHGATLYLISETQQHSPELLDAFVEKHQLTHALLPPALLPHLMQAKWRSVTTLIVGGEAISPDIAMQWKSGRQLYNAYGPTETTVCVAMASLVSKKITIGQPLNNITVRLLDSNGHLVPIGVAGELCIGGVQLARGYLHDPEMSAKKFIIDPTDETHTQRLYRTGDLARWLPDGNLEFMGRLDSQVKIRGYRIELGEIEATLAANENLSNAVVIAYDHDSEDKKLIAYVCPTAAWLAEKSSAFNVDYL